MSRDPPSYAVVAFVALAGCGGPVAPSDAASDAPADRGPPVDTYVPWDTGPGDAGAVDTGPPDTGWIPADHEPFPQIPNVGGHIIAHPQIVTLTYRNDTNATRYSDYANWLVGSNWLRTVGAEYGVGNGSMLGSAQWSSLAPATSDDRAARNLLNLALQSGSIPVPPDGDFSSVIYVMFFPRSTAYTRPERTGGTGYGCQDFLAYHSTEPFNGASVAFAVVLDCGITEGTTELASTQIGLSHEIIEAATDTDIHDPAYAFTGVDNTAWAWLGGEVADLCTGRLDYIVESGFAAAKVWSNAAAAAGTDPCAPSDPRAVYFNTSATPGDYQVATPGQTVTYTLRGFSTGMMADWPLSVRAGGDFTPTWALSATTMNNGGSATLDVTVPATATTGAALVELTSGDPQGVHHVWPMVVVVM